MDWWVKPVENIADLLGDTRIMAPICLAGSLIIMSMCVLVYTMRNSKANAVYPEDFEELDDVGAPPKDAPWSVPLLSREAGERAPHASPGLAQQDRVRISKDVLPGFGIVLAVVFGLLLFVVITTLHRADAMPIANDPQCICPQDDQQQDHEDGGSTGGLVEKLINSSKCFCKNRWESLPSLESLPSNPSESLCKEMENTIHPQEIPVKFLSGDQVNREVATNESLPGNHSLDIKGTPFAATEMRMIEGNDSVDLSTGDGRPLTRMRPGLVRKKRDNPESPEKKSDDPETPEKKSEDPPEKHFEGRWEFFSSKNTEIVLTLGLLVVIIALAVCHGLSYLQNLIEKICAKRRQNEMVVVYHQAPQPT